MKTPFGVFSSVGWMGRCAVALVTLMFCVSAFADPSKNVVTPREKAARAQVVQRVPGKKNIYMVISGSAIPQPIDRIAGPIATTAIPMTVIGNRAGD